LSHETEEDMSKTLGKAPLLTIAVVLTALAGTTRIAAAIGGYNPSSVPEQPRTQQQHPAHPGTRGAHSKKPKAHSRKSSSAEDFLAGYHKAYALIYDKGDYNGGIATLRALGQDNNADVATLIGYASRKLGRYANAKFWYDKALAADPNHAVTWSYYGMWEAEQGNVLKAKDDLEKVRTICGTDCRAYTMLKAAIDGTATY
jgi:tetratricopeptide (TPR) repeat protein